MSVYRTSDGDTADLIALRVYGVTAEATEALLEANPGLADRGLTLPAGIEIDLPAPPERLPSKPVRLWD